MHHRLSRARQYHWSCETPAGNLGEFYNHRGPWCFKAAKRLSLDIKGTDAIQNRMCAKCSPRQESLLGRENWTPWQSTEYIFTCSPRTSYCTVGMAGLSNICQHGQDQHARGGWGDISSCWESSLGKLEGKSSSFTSLAFGGLGGMTRKYKWAAQIFC